MMKKEGMRNSKSLQGPLHITNLTPPYISKRISARTILNTALALSISLLDAVEVYSGVLILFLVHVSTSYSNNIEMRV
jgi:hypothetical protein